MAKKKKCTCGGGPYLHPEVNSAKDVLTKVHHRDPVIRCAVLFAACVHKRAGREACKKALKRPALFKGKLPCAAHDDDLQEALDEAVWTLSDTDKELAKLAVPWRVEQLVARLDETADGRFVKLVQRPRPAVHELRPLYFAIEQAGLLSQWLSEPTPKWRLKLVVDALRGHPLTDLQLWKLVEGGRACEAAVAGGLTTRAIAQGSPLLSVLAALHDPSSDEPGQRALRDLLRARGLLENEARPEVTLPDPMPTRIPDVVALYDLLKLDGEALVRQPPVTEKKLRTFERKYGRPPDPVRQLLLVADGLGALSEVGGTDELPSLQADLAAVLADDMARVREDGGSGKEKSYGVRDLRRHLPLSQLLAVGRRPSGDIAFVNLKRHERRKFPVYVTNHELLFGCDRLTSSYAEFVTDVILQACEDR